MEESGPWCVVRHCGTGDVVCASQMVLGSWALGLNAALQQTLLWQVIY